MGTEPVTSGLCDRYGFDASAISERVSLVGLDGPDNRAQGAALQEQVIQPNSDAIMNGLLDWLSRLEQYKDFVGDDSGVARLRDKLAGYVSSLGLEYEHHHYFEERLRIGFIHHNIGVPQSLYQCSFQALQGLLIRHIPRDLLRDKDEFDSMLQFILRITSLDMSLAVECYCASRMCGLEDSLQDERGRSNRLRRLAITDWLTGLHNHSYSRDVLGEALEQALPESAPLCIIMADLDRFKRINDEHGHLVGDEVLRIAASRLVSGARVRDEICRYGGEEFLFIMRDTDISAAEEVAERVRSETQTA